MSRTTFLNRVKSSEYPQPVRLGGRSVAWRVEDVRSLIEKLGA
ncbi:MAG: AlpA family phage regulatory protein [Methylococcaceae bacterium]|jgi:predicted DNA-binding transcriptional regulator AlpA